ncbi:MAG: hypothetical protein LW875_10335 [Proteobacteria bacterium]|nr:hypothetical protein [Pseudomonadota bacterium]
MTSWLFLFAPIKFTIQKMKAKGLALILLLLSLVAVGCQVYENDGRKSFENRAPSNTVASLQGDEDFSSEDSSLCWSQPAKEALWQQDTGLEAHVKFLNPDIIEVCLTLPAN